ncbi:hypothetical protein CRG98_001232 [Punica granatum]|uniref:Uncharacterized protein n=1 Tax=Punica granatum TaxID=22663 RepID=A0A2I0LCF7_PUNGR|nr:hypothetical protein CRG98_001232 [Punica granatum]
MSSPAKSPNALSSLSSFTGAHWPQAKSDARVHASPRTCLIPIPYASTREVFDDEVPLTKLKMQTIERITQYRRSCLPRTFNGFSRAHLSIRHPPGESQDTVEDNNCTKHLLWATSTNEDRGIPVQQSHRGNLLFSF